MVQLIAVAAIGGVAWVAWSSLQKHLARIAEEERIEKAREMKSEGELEKDPETGRYRPKD